MAITSYDWSRYWDLVTVFIKQFDPSWKYELQEWARDFGNREDLNYNERYNALVRYAHSVIDPIEESIASNTSNAIYDDAKSTISTLISGLTSDVESLYDNTIAEIKSFTLPVFESIDTLIQGLWDVITSIPEKLVALYEQARSTVVDLYDRAVEYLELQYRDFMTSIDDVLNRATEMLENVYEYSASKIRDVYETVSDYIELEYTSAISNINALYGSVQIGVEGLLDDATEPIVSALETFSEFTDSVQATVGKLIDTVADEIAPKLGRLLDLLGFPMGLIDDEYNRSAIDEAKSVVKSVFSGMIDPDDNLIDSVRSVVNEDGGSTVLSKFVYVIMMLIMTGAHTGQAAGILVAPKATKALQEINSMYPVANYSLADIVSLSAKRLVNDSEAVQHAAMEGYDEVKFKKLVEGSQSALDVERLTEAYHRGTLDNETYRASLARLGIRDTDIDTIVSLSEVIPPLTDIIPMAVHEAFSPELARSLGLYDEFPEEFGVWASKRGLSEEWAKRYWAAHWRYPSANQGFEMLFRGVINRDQLSDLMKALDIPAVWRDRLLQIAYRPITRVDIRRIYKLGLIDREGVYKAHLDLGYAPDRAELMTQFTEVYSGPDEEDDDVDFRDLSRTQIKRLWSLRTMDDDEAVSGLITAGYSEMASRMLVKSWSDEEAISYRESLITRLVRKAIKLDLDVEGIDDLFVGLDLTQEERRQIIEIVDTEREEYDAVPSKTELKSMITEKIITYDEWYAGMRSHRYSHKWIEAYAQLWAFTEGI